MKASFRSFGIAPAFLLLASVAAHAQECQPVEGQFSAVAPKQCSSPVNVCTQGTLSGEFQSSYDFTATQMTPIGNQGFDYAGKSVITRAESADRLFGEDLGTMTLNGDGTADFVTKVSIHGGSGEMADAYGFIVAEGQMDFRTGQTSGKYRGRICRPRQIPVR